ncbi:FAD:protein FMN transferase [Edaphocola flava]|uniref:FAD:protein FMN transferase n=1 Tax=Edaphocola flava TaxID=2499629 RepID=UPI00100AA425|nr:FAD:protein FMN transferase [Edaphocola flava]
MKVYTKVEKLMGSVFTLGIAAASDSQAAQLLDIGIAEIRRIEDMLSEFKPDSETILINRSAPGKPVTVSAECFAIIKRSLDMSKLSKGDFDITVSPLKKLYRFKNTAFAMPAAEEIKSTLQTIGYTKILTDEAVQAVGFIAEGMQISFAAIGKGYAADRVKMLWKNAGVLSGYINASGDLCAFGNKPDGQPWTVGIANPDNPAEILFYIPLKDSAVATSGDYEQHFIHEGKRYSHNIDPHSGLPISGIKSVSVFSPAAELSDALATAVYVKGISKGMDFINQLPHTHCIIIDEDNQVYGSEQLQ